MEIPSVTGKPKDHKLTIWNIIRAYLLNREFATTKELFAEIRRHRPNFSQKMFHNRITRLKSSKDIKRIGYGKYTLTQQGRYEWPSLSDTERPKQSGAIQAPKPDQKECHEVKRTPRPKFIPPPDLGIKADKPATEDKPATPLSDQFDYGDPRYCCDRKAIDAYQRREAHASEKAGLATGATQIIELELPLKLRLRVSVEVMP